jgi:hypothetical protein
MRNKEFVVGSSIAHVGHVLVVRRQCTMSAPAVTVNGISNYPNTGVASLGNAPFMPPTINETPHVWRRCERIISSIT